jgi:hypothetical protein
MMNHFHEARRGRYDDRIHAIKVIAAGEINLGPE